MPNPMVKIFVSAKAMTGYLPVSTESLNAKAISRGLFQLKNSSLLRPGLAYEDTVVAKPDRQGILWYESTAKMSAYSSIRIACTQGDFETLENYLNEMESCGCGISGSLEHRVALITIPPDVPYQKILDLAKLLGSGFIVRQMARRKA